MPGFFDVKITFNDLLATGTEIILPQVELD